MWKRVLGSAVLVGLVGILVVGAINRTMARTEKTTEGQGQGQGRGRSVQGSAVNVGNGPGQGQSQGFGQGRSSDNLEAVGGNGSRGGRTGGPERQYLNQESSREEWMTYEGTVVQVPGAGEGLVIETESGETLEFGTGPLDLATQGVPLQLGEAVQVKGYWENNELKAAQITRLDSGQSFALRDEYGRPAWAGNGRNAEQVDQSEVGKAEVTEWVELPGSVTFVDTESLVVVTPDGEEIEVTGRSWRFAQEIGFWVEVGEVLTLTGFFDEGEFEVALIGSASDQTVVLRDENGRPMWAGRGQRGG